MSGTHRGRGGRRDGAAGNHRCRGGYRGGGYSGEGQQRAYVSAAAHNIALSASRWSDGDSEGDQNTTNVFAEQRSAPPAGEPCSALHAFLQDVDGSSYGHLKQLTGRVFALTESRMPDPGAVTVRFVRIQPDPFAPGSQICVTMPAPFSVRSLLNSAAAVPPTQTPDITAAGDVSIEDVAWRRVAAEDFLLRCVRRGLSGRRTDGALQILSISQHVLPRSTVQLVDTDFAEASTTQASADGCIHVFLRVKLPGHGRRIDGQGIHRILFSSLLPVFQDSVMRCSHSALWAHVTSVADQEWLRRQLPSSGLVAFIADGAVLPRTAGDLDLPLTGETVVPFTAPATLSRTFVLPFSGRTISGAGIPRGLTLIAGGGFHGKSTLLRALELGVYNHIPDDGRTFVVVDPTAVKIRAEDRRAVQGVDISSFIGNLPFDKDTSAFSTSDASGSTSQAANIMEALELGSTALLLDEDTSATNFMYRDTLMEQLVPPSQEPITSFVHRVRDLVEHHAVSVILVVGGSGQYFSKADVVLVMNAYHVRDATAQVRKLLRHSTDINGAVFDAATSTTHPATSAFRLPPQRRFVYDASFKQLLRQSPQGRGRGLKVSGLGTERVRMGEEVIELALVEQLVEEGQLNAIAQCLAMLHDEGSVAAEKAQRERITAPPYPPPLWMPNFGPPVHAGTPSASRQLQVSDYCLLLHNCESRLRQSRLELRTPSCYLPYGFSSLPRVFELGAALNRLRTLITACR